MLSKLIAQARQATGAAEHYTPGFTEPTHITAQRAASAGVVRLADPLPEYTLDPQRPTQALVQHQAGRRVPMSTAILQNSRVCQAGARLVPVEAAPDAVPMGNGEMVWQRRASRFSVIEAGVFQPVEDGDDATATALPILSTEIAPGDSATHGLRLEIPRTMLKEHGDEWVEHVAMTALALGLSNLADAVLLAAIKSATPGAFSIGAAAARGLRFGELRGIVGTAGNGAAVGADGALRAAGVAAELSDQIDATFVGSFARAGVAVNEEIFLIVDRVNVAGAMALTAWVNLQPLLPDATAFWNVPAVEAA
ncbi:hypothetical protein [Bordetella petrii]|nr:hypothetical protein [Bordetella petrii]